MAARAAGARRHAEGSEGVGCEQWRRAGRPFGSHRKVLNWRPKATVDGVRGLCPGAVAHMLHRSAVLPERVKFVFRHKPWSAGDKTWHGWW
jgi:hypothetical protein